MVRGGWQRRLLGSGGRLLLRLLSLVALGGILPDSAGAAELTPICAIQGASFSSPFQGQIVTARGVVFADLDQTSRKGFFIQDEPCDGDPATSDGIFVYLGEKAEVVNAGDLVEVVGVVEEYYGLTEVVTAPPGVVLLSAGNPLPLPQELAPPFDNSAARQYFESLEGMSVQLSQGLVVGPTDADDRSWLIRADLGLPRVFQDDPLGSGEIICADDGGLYEITPEAKSGDQVEALQGAFDYRLGIYCLQPLSPPTLIPAAAEVRSSQETHFSFTLATFNLYNLFDNLDDPATQDDVLSSPEYQRRLQKRALAIHEALGEPALIAVQEVESATVLQALIDRPEILAEYDLILEEGLDERGLDVALLYRTDRVQARSHQARQGCTSLVDGLGPDGNQDVYHPQNALTCDTDGDGVSDGNRLFSRPPLVAQMRVCQEACLPGEPSVALWVVVNHWKSKTEDTQQVQYTLPRRLEQAQFVAGLVEEIRTVDPAANVVVLGDLNDYPDSQPLAALTNSGLANLLLEVERQNRYTYIYRGVSQVLDHVLIWFQPWLMPTSVNPLHINADYPYSYMGDASSLQRSSDHDPVLVEVTLREFPLFLPVIMH